MTRVGIPHGLFYYYYYPWWKTFFNYLGAEVVCSNPTTRLTVDQGIGAAVDEICFPLKVYFGHVLELKRYELDWIFIPRMVSVEHRSYICPKFMGLPDMIRASIPDLPPIIDITVDVSQSNRILKRDLLQLGKLFTSRESRIREAIKRAREEQNFCDTLAGQGYTREEAIQLWEGKATHSFQAPILNLGVLGHGYSLYDAVINMNLINHLRNMGCRLWFPESLDADDVETSAATIPKRVFWTLGRKMVGSAIHLSQQPEIDGIIYLACFGCGPDSLIGEIIERQINDKPYMLLTVDEHSGETGMITRLEAFCDMLLRRKNTGNEDNISAHGQYAYCRQGTI